MSQFSGYDSEAVGFDTVSQKKRAETTSSTQTYFSETGTASQTNVSVDCGSSVTASDLNAEDDILREYPPPGLNDFLRKVVPGVMEQLDQNDKEFLYNSSDSDEEEPLEAKLFQEINTKAEYSGDAGEAAVLSISWSVWTSLAVTVGQPQHENWCQHDGLIKIYKVNRSDHNKLVHELDISDKSCIGVVKYHPSIKDFLAYGTTSGEVVLCNLWNRNEDGMQLSSPAGCHGSQRVTALEWADASLANTFLMMQINKTGKRRGAADQVLISSGSDGTINVWQVNKNLKVFECIVCYAINSSRKGPPLDITCFDFIKTYPLRPSEDRVPDDIFVVGTKSGRLYLCKIKTNQLDVVDPVYHVLEGHSTCVLDVVFSCHKPGYFASMSMDSELRVYDVNQSAPLKVLCLDSPVSCMSWVPGGPSVAVLGLAGAEAALAMCEVAGAGEKVLPVRGLGSPGAPVSALAVAKSGPCRIAAGDSEGRVYIWDVPWRRYRVGSKDLEF